jgi:peptidoglycan L-alanyl-D-glutamate endopeptidase CwlK
MASRHIHHLHADMQWRVLAWQEECEREGLEVLITCTWRSPAEQNELYAQGRTKPGDIVTRARGGQSDHNHRDPDTQRPASLAVDFVPLRGGKLVWGTKGNGIDSDPTDNHKDDLELWQRCAVIAKKYGLVWYGEPGSEFKEFPHLRHPDARQIRGLQEAV